MSRKPEKSIIESVGSKGTFESRIMKIALATLNLEVSTSLAIEDLMKSVTAKTNRTIPCNKKKIDRKKQIEAETI